MNVGTGPSRVGTDLQGDTALVDGCKSQIAKAINQAPEGGRPSRSLSLGRALGNQVLVSQIPKARISAKTGFALEITQRSRLVRRVSPL